MPERKGSIRAPVLWRHGRTDRGLAPSVDKVKSAEFMQVHRPLLFSLNGDIKKAFSDLRSHEARAAEWSSRDTKFLTASMNKDWISLVPFKRWVGDECMTFRVLICAPVPNGSMSSSFPWDHGLTLGPRWIVEIWPTSSLDVSGPKGKVGALCSFFLCGAMPGRERNASRQ
ncbi:hypothetical protein E5676_scaffold808G00580 [Cucumis melo var. makuwa]|uniref:Uncharacterized protein n=1 Tax=Cucumis melo var. makuwa TaxID=1194695 RepID=A0A5D3BS76_CUCMM|nr:hypothetical protein E6C27_scaffold277G00810 [Cucumis melo var. makuwa]TYK01960.1 hypothetical protein E5676_scaffold808G00580 [Cucumis melo var. makuwa]